MARPRRTVLAVVSVLVVVVIGAAAAAALWWRDGERSALAEAVAMAPPESQRYSWTSWAQVRTETGAELDDASSSADLRAFLDAAYELDLSSTSALVESAQVLQVRYGFSPATADWELFSQGPGGAAIMLGMPDDTDFDELGTRLEELGYTRPAEEDGAWFGGKDLLAEIGGVTPELQYVALDADRGLVLASDTPDYLGVARDAVADPRDPPQGLDDVVSASGEPLAAAVYTGEQACVGLAMSQAGDADQRLGEQLVEQAGEVNPLTGFAMSVQPDGGVRVALGFETAEQARTNADTRAVLAEGPAVGQGGDFADRFAVDAVTADDRVVRMDLDPVDGAFVLSDLSTGPVLFATC
ncbi:hypothetical protein [Nocardioides ferulae]|uniref:hypothetical protein n=1 Tax=Nocardioides ferulae TaxID=2340821 RepID=UPI000F863942|nr:hypothetical protein [Nocardioides ferulae]